MTKKQVKILVKNQKYGGTTSDFRLPTSDFGLPTSFFQLKNYDSTIL